MASVEKVVIIGERQVGKSTLFKHICGTGDTSGRVSGDFGFCERGKGPLRVKLNVWDDVGVLTRQMSRNA